MIYYIATIAYGLIFRKHSFVIIIYMLMFFFIQPYPRFGNIKNTDKNLTGSFACLNLEILKNVSNSSVKYGRKYNEDTLVREINKISRKNCCNYAKNYFMCVNI